MVEEKEEMSKEFQMPNFGERELELRCENGEVCIYATKTGLESLMYFCEKLLKNPGAGHIHLEDYEILTQDSLKGTLAIFES
jgi:hypothetical protein